MLDSLSLREETENEKRSVQILDLYERTEKKAVGEGTYGEVRGCVGALLLFGLRVNLRRGIKMFARF